MGRQHFQSDKFSDIYKNKPSRYIYKRINFASMTSVLIYKMYSQLKICLCFFQIFDYGIIYRYLMIAGCALFIIIGLVAYLSDHMMMPIYAKPIRRLR